eukprot:412447-Rhodomonas_salina.4
MSRPGRSIASVSTGHGVARYSRMLQHVSTGHGAALGSRMIPAHRRTQTRSGTTGPALSVLDIA